MAFSVLYDSCVLYPATLRDLLVTLATTRLFRARWTASIHDEWIRSLHEDRPDIAIPVLQRTRQLMDRAFRSMKAPGTAYDGPKLGRDPQPATMQGFVDTFMDNGGVHTNSGIPNYAFYLAATKIGGHSWEKAGQIWYRALVNRLQPTSD